MNANVALPPQDPPVIEAGHTLGSVTDKVGYVVLTRTTPPAWLGGFAVAFTLMMVLMLAISYLLAKGVGVWGIKIPVAWGFAIVNFVWWIGIGHAGTLISAFLLLMHQEWRASINRFAEAMTLFAVACAGMFPLLHLGRPWYFYWLFPYPSTMGVWPQFRSPLVWDVFAVSTYATVSFLFWCVGLLPDVATMRDKAKHWFPRKVYGVLAMGWRGSAIHWRRYEDAYVLLAGIATPLVVSVHSVVSFDFTIAILPGWHSTIFPPYFVAGAIFSGFAMVLTLMIPLRSLYGLQGFITAKHLDNMAKVLLVTGLMVDYGYFMETLMAWYSGNPLEEYMMMNRVFGPYGWVFWLVVVCNVLAPQACWSRRVRCSVPALFVIALLVNLGMWLERFMIIVVGLHRDFMPSAWDMYYPTIWDWATLFGSVGLFLALIFLFVRVLPSISMFELRQLVSRPGYERGSDE